MADTFALRAPRTLLPALNTLTAIEQLILVDAIEGIYEDLHSLVSRERNGSVTLDSGTKAVTFSSAMEVSTYAITLSGDANQTFRWASKTTTGFTINSSDGGSTANVDYHVKVN